MERVNYLSGKWETVTEPPPVAENKEKSRSSLYKALVVSITYVGSSNRLYAPEKDLWTMIKILRNEFGYQYSDIRVLTDVSIDQASAQYYESVRAPTAGNIVKGMEWTTENATGHSTLFFYFSGHGIQVKDHTGEEDDGMNECLVASDDYFISDDTIRSVLVNRVPLRARLACMVDSCHSGNCADLTYYVKLRDVFEGGDSPSVRKYPTQIQGSTEVYKSRQSVTMPSKQYPALGQPLHNVASGYKGANPKYPLQSPSQGTGAYPPNAERQLLTACTSAQWRIRGILWKWEPLSESWLPIETAVLPKFAVR
mmetsp:Transcript_17437/g.25029  ORF Transcript_17437/g.25029 Transcript_17437/m.25029 type:complete len:311 (+) Transcript_17437:519-1451(+)